MRPQLLIILGLVLLLLVGCGKETTTTNASGNVAKDPITEPVQTTPVNPEPASPTDTQEKPIADKEKIGLEAAGLFESKYCNYKVSQLQLSINNKKNSLTKLQDQKDTPESVKSEIASLQTDLAGLEKDLGSMKETCGRSTYGDACGFYTKDAETTLESAKAELTDDKESLEKWQKKLDEAKAASKLMDMTIAQAKVDKITPRVLTEENQVNTFTAMLEDLKGFC